MAAGGYAVAVGRTGLGDAGDEDLNVLADAIKKMDGLIGDFRPTVQEPPEPVLTTDPAVQAVVEHCEQLASLIGRLRQQSPSSDTVHPRECVPPSIQEEIISWLGGLSLEESQQLSHDKDELLGQMVSLQQQLEFAQQECTRLTAKVASVEKRCVEKEQRLRDLNEELKLKKTSLATKEVELRHLQDQIQAGYQGGGKQVTFGVSASQETPPHRRSFRKALKKAFSRKERHTATLKGAAAASHPPVNPRADAFLAKDSEALTDWFKSIGLEMYLDLISEKGLTGERLAEVVAEEDCHQLVQIGILSTLHCKKVRLAVQEALSEEPSPLAELDHDWVGQWLLDIGLPQFQRTFHDARVDGCMLNQITLEDLKLMDVTVPFHIASIKRALQAFRMCGFDKNYLKESCPGKQQGSQKLLHWSAKDVKQWVRSIELDEYVATLDKMGIHGAIMLLDVNFSSESLARALGISQTKAIIRKHLSKKFMELIGPVAAQNKVDALQSKSFVPLDPTEAPSGFSRNRSRSVGHRRSKDKGNVQHLLPLDQFPVAPTPTIDVTPMSPVSDAASSTDIPRYPTP